MADIKNYIQTITKRLETAFSLEDFSTEDELNFWALAAEYLSKTERPSFQDIVGWIDLLYHAPVHFAYIKESEQKLQLFHRIVLTQNVEKSLALDQKEDKKQEQAVAAFEDRLGNLTPRIRWNQDMADFGTSSFPIGNCYHIPLYEDNICKGIYCVGPYVENPKPIIPRLPIVGRILAKWLLRAFEEEHTPKNTVRAKAENHYKALSVKNIYLKEYADVFLNYITNAKDISVASLIEYGESANIIAQSEVGKDLQQLINNLELRDPTPEAIKNYLQEHALATEFNAPPYIHVESVGSKKKPVFILAGSDSMKGFPTRQNDTYSAIMSALSGLIKYRDQKDTITGLITDAFYHMIRDIEQRQERTKYHTDRMVALTGAFADHFGMNSEEKAKIIQTAKLHDIGYLSTEHFENKETLGAEMEHPLLAELLIKNLSIADDVVSGIKTHHEWVNGKGFPEGLKEQEIPWTGKITAIFEYIVEFIEKHRWDSTKTEAEQIEQLSQSLLERAGIRFDIVLIPSVIEMIKNLGWNKLCKMGEGRDENNVE